MKLNYLQVIPSMAINTEKILSLKCVVKKKEVASVEI